MSQRKGKSLSERLAELANPTPQFVDPEDEYNEETKARLDSFDEQFDENEKAYGKPLKNNPSLRKKSIELLAASDKRYAGKKVSRRDLELASNDSFEVDSSDDSDAESVDNILQFKNQFKKEAIKYKECMPNTSQGSDDENNINSEFGEEEDSEDENESLAEGSDEEEQELEEEEGDEIEEEGDEGEEEGEEEMEASGEEETYSEEGGDDNELEQNQMEFEDQGSTDQEENEIRGETKGSENMDINKGKAIKNQISLWDNLLECRIKLHKTINLSNQLPQAPSNFNLFTEVVGENHFITASQGAQTALKTMINSCFELQDLLFKSNPQMKSLMKRKSSQNGTTSDGDSDEEIPSDTDEEAKEDDEELEVKGPERKKLKVSEYEKEINERHENCRDFFYRTLSLWSEKTKLASGRSGLGGKSGFSAFDQSILKQIEGILADKQRLINRTRVKRSIYRVLGSVLTSQETTKSTEEEKREEPDISDSKRIKHEELDPEIYDDDDFYHQLLREVIEKKAVDGGSNHIALGRQWLEIQKLRSKAKRKVDTKASKGRRLRYQVHPKLVSFMAPYPENSWNDIAKNELFSSLFGSGLCDK